MAPETKEALEKSRAKAAKPPEVVIVPEPPKPSEPAVRAARRVIRKPARQAGGKKLDKAVKLSPRSLWKLKVAEAQLNKRAGRIVEDALQPVFERIDFPAIPGWVKDLELEDGQAGEPMAA